MTARRFVVIIALCVLVLPLTLGAEEPADKSAGETVEKFMAAVKSKDLDAVMQTVEVPWFHKGDEIIKERSELKKEFDSLFTKRDFKDLKFEIKKIAAFSAVREKTMGDERKLLDEVLTGDDRVVLLEIETEKKGKEKLILLVKVKEGKGKVVGIRD